MNRRALLAGVGALCVAGGMGTSAFSSVEATRSVSVNVENDQRAYLALDGSSQNFTEGGRRISFSFDDEVSPEDGGTFKQTGDGLGANSVYEFPNLFRIQNLGTDTAVAFGEFDGGKLESVQLIGEGRREPLTRSNPSSKIPAPGGFIRAGLRIEVGNIPPQEVDTEITIGAATGDSELYPEVFPDGTTSDQ